jgi:octaprenyl-diphosphate synthase
MALAKVLDPIGDEMAAVEARLREVAEGIGSSAGPGPSADGLGRSDILVEIARHPFSVPGKRLRPALVLLSSLAAGRSKASAPPREALPPREAAIGLAAAVEVLHSASLVHDDIIDGAEERRHQVSLNKRFGNRVAVLAGDILYTEFFSMLTSLPVPDELRSRLLALFLGTTRKMCVGEILAQETASSGRSLSFEEYLEISEDKTASLFSACCEGGALVGGASDEGARALGEFGLLFGLTFQMLDDLADRDHGLEPGVDLKGLTMEYAARAKAAAARSLASEGVAELLEHVLDQALSP